MTRASDLVRARAKGMRDACEVARDHEDVLRLDFAADTLDELAAQIDALPAEPVGAVESACAWLDSHAVGGLDVQREAVTGRWSMHAMNIGWERGGPLAACIIAAARALGWTPPAEPVGLPVIATCGDCSHNALPFWSPDYICMHGLDDNAKPHDRSVLREMAPPSWCPLREKGGGT